MDDRDFEAALRAGAAALNLACAPPAIDERATEARLLDLAYVRHDSPVGPLLLAASPRGLICVRYLDGQADEPAALAELAQRVSPRILSAPRRLDEPRRELDEFFAGTRDRFEIALDRQLIGPGFASRVLSATARIPYGETSSYQRVAGAAGSPRAFRAAGTALGANPLPIVIPCHRVLHSGGGLGGYAGGPERKRRLLAVEGDAQAGDSH